MIRLFNILKRYYKSVELILQATREVLKSLDWSDETVLILETFRMLLKQCLEQETSTMSGSPPPYVIMKNQEVQTDPKVNILSDQILPKISVTPIMKNSPNNYSKNSKSPKKMPYWMQRKNQVKKTSMTGTQIEQEMKQNQENDEVDQICQAVPDNLLNQWSNPIPST